MGESTTPFEYVFVSAVRRGTLDALARNPLDRRTVVDRLDACDSAVYDAFTGLAERGLIVREDDHWVLTGTGRAVADCLEYCRRVDETVHTAPVYWRTHNLECLPRDVRAEVITTTDYSVVRSSEGDRDVVSHLATALDGARSAGLIVGAPLSELPCALQDVPHARVVCSSTAASTWGDLEVRRTQPSKPCEEADDDTASGTGDDTDTDSDTTVRILPRERLPYTMVVTDDVVAFVLPTLEDEQTHASILFVEDESVCARCWTHFVACWRRAATLEDRERDGDRSETRGQARVPSRSS